jgi:hypothetical protein
VGAEYHAAIERFSQVEPAARRSRTVKAISLIDVPNGPSDSDLGGVARGLAALHGGFGLKKLLVDVSGSESLTSGQRESWWSLLEEMVRKAPFGFRVEPVKWHKDLLLHAHTLTCRQFGLPPMSWTNEPVDVRRGDIYLPVSDTNSADATDRRTAILSRFGASMWDDASGFLLRSDPVWEQFDSSYQALCNHVSV